MISNIEYIIDSRNAKCNMIEKVMNRKITFQPDLLGYLYKTFYHCKKKIRSPFLHQFSFENQSLISLCDPAIGFDVTIW